jgi:long-chain acyl-CoA synthetase
MPELFLQRVIASCTRHADRVAMRVVGDDTQVYTFGEMLARARSVASKLDENGVEKGDRVALIGENHPAWAIAYLGILFRGAVCVPLDPHGEIETLSNFIENSEARLVFLDREAAEKFTQIESRILRTVP